MSSSEWKNRLFCVGGSSCDSVAHMCRIRGIQLVSLEHLSEARAVVESGKCNTENDIFIIHASHDSREKAIELAQYIHNLGFNVLLFMVNSSTPSDVEFSVARAGYQVNTTIFKWIVSSLEVEEPVPA